MGPVGGAPDLPEGGLHHQLQLSVAVREWGLGWSDSFHLQEKPGIQGLKCKMFIAALFTIARTWDQPKCPLTDEWIKKMWHIYTMEYYSAVKRKEIMLFVVDELL